MYLINALTLKLERFDDEARIPRYAILSHTWGDSEITFEEFHTLQAQNGLRSWKIRQTCAQARRNGFGYAWVDTCCIDKRSSAELSEAINSMFRWYEKASMCYAYLGDVDGCMATMGEDEIDACGELTKAKWFKRGWTLQELIAPSSVTFYDKNWRYLGTKASLSDALATITGIPKSVLHREVDLGTINIAQKMSWAASRVTTRTEDMAYSMLGIFDVNMPLLYGEGEKAFVRLQEEIMKDSNDQSLFAWTPPDRSESVLPMARYQWISAFARHPREFASSTLRIYRSNPITFALTNNGIKIHVPVLPFHAGYWSKKWPPGGGPTFDDVIRQDPPLVLVVLNCHFKAGEHQDRRVAIVCQCVD